MNKNQDINTVIKTFAQNNHSNKVQKCRHQNLSPQDYGLSMQVDNI